MVSGVTNSILTAFYKFGQDNRLVSMSTDVASLSIRSPLTLLDKNAKKEDRVHASLWQAVDYGSAIAIQLSVFPIIPKVGKFLAKNIFKYTKPEAISGTVKFTNFFLGYFLCTSVLMPFVNSKYLARVINFVSEKFTGKKMMPKKEEEQLKQQAEQRQKRKELKEKISTKIEGVLGKGLTGAIKTATGGMGKLVSLAMTPIVLPVKLVSSMLASLTVSTVNIFGGKIKDREKAKENIAGAFKKILYTGLTSIPLMLLAKKFGPGVGQKIQKFMVKQDNLSATTMIIMALTGDALAKPLIVLVNGAPYMALRKLLDQGISVSILRFSKPSISKLTTVLTKSMGLNSIQSEGMRTLLTTGLQTVFLLNVMLPMINNQITGRLLNKIMPDRSKKKETQAPQESVKNDFLVGQARQAKPAPVNHPVETFPLNNIKYVYDTQLKSFRKVNNPFAPQENIFEIFEKFIASSEEGLFITNSPISTTR